ncbi:MAG TPA: hypothetical protein VGH67_06285 [Solirubrobacteraceae bacterium]
MTGAGVALLVAVVAAEPWVLGAAAVCAAGEVVSVAEAGVLALALLAGAVAEVADAEGLLTGAEGSVAGEGAGVTGAVAWAAVLPTGAVVFWAAAVAGAAVAEAEEGPAADAAPTPRVQNSAVQISRPRTQARRANERGPRLLIASTDPPASENFPSVPTSTVCCLP